MGEDNLAAAGKGELPQDIYEAAKNEAARVLSVHQAAAP